MIDCKVVSFSFDIIKVLLFFCLSHNIDKILSIKFILLRKCVWIRNYNEASEWKKIDEVSSAAVVFAARQKLFQFFISIHDVIGFEWIMMIERCFLDWVRAIWIEISPSFSLTFIAQGSKFNENLHQKKSFKIYENFPSLDVYFEFCNFFHVWWSRRKSVKRRADCRVISVGESLKEKGKQKNLSKRAPEWIFHLLKLPGTCSLD